MDCHTLNNSITHHDPFSPTSARSDGDGGEESADSGNLDQDDQVGQAWGSAVLSLLVQDFSSLFLSEKMCQRGWREDDNQR